MHTDLIRKLLTKRVIANPILRSAINVDQLSNMELMVTPESSIVAIVGMYRSTKRISSMSDVDILRQINDQRNQLIQVAVIPSNINTLSKYVKYRIRIDHQTGLPLSDAFIDESIGEILSYLSK
jgi:hypothetical protein